MNELLLPTNIKISLFMKDNPFAQLCKVSNYFDTLCEIKNAKTTENVTGNHISNILKRLQD